MEADKQKLVSRLIKQYAKLKTEEQENDFIRKNFMRPRVKKLNPGSIKNKAPENKALRAFEVDGVTIHALNEKNARRKYENSLKQ